MSMNATDLGAVLRVLLRSYLDTAEPVLARIPGGQLGYEVLGAVADGYDGTQQAMAARLGIDRSVLTNRVDDLVRAGLLSGASRPPTGARGASRSPGPAGQHWTMRAYSSTGRKQKSWPDSRNAGGRCFSNSSRSWRGRATGRTSRGRQSGGDRPSTFPRCARGATIPTLHWMDPT
ncbi:hypothetical protein ACQP00_20430 [Dactylosporangium sp. CS-047395]|uniref:hypothetical protein n=1 Tax=Dactylosporangium sp. CS-047395 TaxID=3239936 RepID=UPI003D91DDA8